MSTTYEDSNGVVQSIPTVTRGHQVTVHGTNVGPISEVSSILDGDDSIFEVFDSEENVYKHVENFTKKMLEDEHKLSNEQREEIRKGTKSLAKSLMPYLIRDKNISKLNVTMQKKVLGMVAEFKNQEDN